ncbi:MAG: pilus assembly protein [Lachnospiraceae bacterium]|nr:pilus assembly protein [Lachnospiraceae bacterium]
MFIKFINKKRKIVLNGYMSIEASFIMPWVIFLFVFIIYTSFYLYDKCVLFQDAYALSLRGSIQKEDGKVLQYINEHMAEQFGNKYFGVGKVEGKAEQSGQEVRVIGTCSVKIPFDNFLTFSNESGWQIQTEAKAQVINPTKVIRKCRMAENIIDSIGG